MGGKLEEKIGLEELVAIFEKAENEIKLCDTIFANSTEAQKKLNLLVSELRGTCASVHERVEEVYNIAHESADNHIKDILNSSKLEIEKAKLEKINVANAEKLISEAEEAYNSGDYKKALNIAMKSEGELEKQSLQYDMACRAIRIAESKIRDANDLGVPLIEVIPYG